MIFLEVTKIEVLEKLRGLDYLKSMIEEHEKDIIEDLKSHYDKKFILDIVSKIICFAYFSKSLFSIKS